MMQGKMWKWEVPSCLKLCIIKYSRTLKAKESSDHICLSSLSLTVLRKGALGEAIGEILC